MKSTTCIILILIVNNISSRTDEELFQEYKPLITNEHQEATNEQKQCIYLNDFFSSFTNANFDSSLVSEIPSFFRKIFNKEEIKLNTFENWTWLIMQELVQYDTEPKEIQKFDAWKRLIKKLPNQSIDQSFDQSIDNTAPKVFKTPDLLINMFKNYPKEDSEKEKQIFDILNILHHGVIKQLNEKLLMSNNSENKVDEQIQKNKNDVEGSIKKIKDGYNKFREEVINFEKLKHEVIDKISTFGESSVLIVEANNYKEITDLLENFKNFPSPDKNENEDSNKLDDYFKKAKIDLGGFGDFGDIFEENSKEIKKLKGIFSGLTEEKKTIDGEKIFISYKNLLEEGRNENYQHLIEKVKVYEQKLEDYKSKMEALMTKIKNSIEESPNFLDMKNKPSLSYLDNDYQKNLKKLKESKIKIKGMIEGDDGIKKKIIELKKFLMRTKLLTWRKSRYDFVFPNNVFIDLQLELANAKKTVEKKPDLENVRDGLKKNLENIKEGTDIGDIDAQKVIKKMEDEINKYKEKIGIIEDQIIKIDKMNYVIELLHIRNDINEIFSRKMGRIMGRLQNMKNDKKCFSLPDLSLFIFKLMKTNMIHFEKFFLEDFLGEYKNFEKKKKFILYNYMISSNREYGLKAINALENNTTEEEIKKREYIENFTINFTLLVTIIRNKTTFSRNELSTKIDPKEISKYIYSMLNLDYQALLTKEKKPDGKFEWVIQNKALDKVFQKLNYIILVALPFLNLIPFINFILKKIEFKIFKGVLFIANKLISATTSFVKNLSNKITSRDFDFNKVMENLDDVIDNEEVVNFQVSMTTMNKIEANYKERTQGNTFDFTLFDSSDNFVYNLDIDVFRISDVNYLIANGVPDLGLGTTRII